MYVMQSLDQVGWIVGRRLFLVRESPEQQFTGQAKLPPDNVGGRHAGGVMGRSSVS